MHVVKAGAHLTRVTESRVRPVQYRVLDAGPRVWRRRKGTVERTDGKESVHHTYIKPYALRPYGYRTHAFHGSFMRRIMPQTTGITVIKRKKKFK